MNHDKRWDQLADLIGTAYQELELYIATRDLRLAEAKPLEREAIFDEGTLRVKAIADAVHELALFDRTKL